jgi:protocatechuate 3,4-dioxygenase beta subunit
MKARQRYHPRLEALEDRIVPTWPLAPQGTQLPIVNTYGQYQEFGGIHFHEGVDVVAPLSANMLAIEAGTVVGVYAHATAYYSYIAVDAGGGNSLNYAHVVPGNKPANRAPVTPRDRPWQIGDTVAVGDVLGTVAQIPQGAPFPPHIHIDRGGGQDPYFAAFPPIVPGTRDLQDMRRPTSNALIAAGLLNPEVDDFDPVVNDIHFKIAAHDRNGAMVRTQDTLAATFTETPRGDNLYFSNLNAQGHLIVGARAPTTAINNPVAVGTGSAQIDILAEIWDRFGEQANVVLNSYRLGVRNVWFRIEGPNADTNWVNSFRFAGEFLDDTGAPLVPGGAAIAVHQYRAFRTTALVRTVYENDQFSNSEQGANGTFWYIVTNTGSTNAAANLVVDFTNRARAWNSTVSAGNTWNAPVAPGTTAPRNAASAFPDDIYVVTVSAGDEAGNEGERETTILLDNWEQTVTTTAAQYQNNQNVIVNGGAQYRANVGHNIYAVPLAGGAAAPADGLVLNVANRVAQNVMSNGNGELPANTNLGMLAVGRYAIIVDYNGDGRFTNRLDAFRVINVVAAPPPGNGAPVNLVPGAQTTAEDTSLVFSSANSNVISTSDPDAGDNAVRVTLTATNGTLTLASLTGLTFLDGDGTDDAAMTFEGTITDINVALDGLTFAPTPDYHGSAMVSILTDDLGNTGGGALTDYDTVDITVTPVNDVPVATDDSYSGQEDTAIFGNVLNNDSDEVEHDLLTIISVNGGNGFLSGPVTLSLGMLQIHPGGAFTFMPNANASGTVAFTYEVSDGHGGTATATVTLTVNPVNDAPAGTDNTVTTVVNNPYTFTATDFGFSDPNDTPAHTFLAVKITTLPSNGSLTRDGVGVSAGDFVSVSDLNSSLLVFTPSANDSGVPYTSFAFQVQDDGGVAGGGVDTDPTPNTMTINVLAASIGDRVWNDANADGIQDSGEWGLGGVTVNLLDEFGNWLNSTTTDSSGYYQFTGLTAGNYKLQFVAPYGYSFTLQDQGADDTLDSDADASGLTVVYSLAANQQRTDVDAGLIYTGSGGSGGSGGSIGNYVWNDANADGIQDSGEWGLGGVTVNLLDEYGNWLNSTTTDSSGYYQFTGLTAGNYRLEFVAPLGYQFSPKDQGTDDTLDSDADPITGWTAVLILSANQTRTDVDAGLIYSGSGGSGGSGGSYALLSDTGDPDPEEAGGDSLLTAQDAEGEDTGGIGLEDLDALFALLANEEDSGAGWLRVL